MLDLCPDPGSDIRVGIPGYASSRRPDPGKIILGDLHIPTILQPACLLHRLCKCNLRTDAFCRGFFIIHLCKCLNIRCTSLRQNFCRISASIRFKIIYQLPCADTAAPHHRILSRLDGCLDSFCLGNCFCFGARYLPLFCHLSFYCAVLFC